MKKILKVWILQTGEPLQSDKSKDRPMRAINLSEELLKRGHKVTIWSSNFYHQQKKFRDVKKESLEINKSFKINLLSSPGYKKNIGIKRLIDHFLLSIDLLRKLIKYKEIPDVVFIGFPPVEVAFVMAWWSKYQKIPYIIDIKDKWPDIFYQSFTGWKRKIIKFFLIPYYLLTKYSLRNANTFCSMTSNYIEWMYRKANIKEKKEEIILPLVAPKIKVKKKDIIKIESWWLKNGLTLDNKLKITFVGSLNYNYNFNPIYDLAKHLEQRIPKCQIVICGKGPIYKDILSLFSNCPNVIIPGWINYEKISILYKYSSATIAPYLSTENFDSNITNKITDSFSYGLPVLTSLDGVLKNIIEKYQVGYYYKSSFDLINKSELLLRNSLELEKMKNNCSYLYSEKYEFKKSYNKIIRHIEKIG